MKQVRNRYLHILHSAAFLRSFASQPLDAQGCSSLFIFGVHLSSLHVAKMQDPVLHWRGERGDGYVLRLGNHVLHCFIMFPSKLAILAALC